MRADGTEARFSMKPSLEAIWGWRRYRVGSAGRRSDRRLVAGAMAVDMTKTRNWIFLNGAANAELNREVHRRRIAGKGRFTRLSWHRGSVTDVDHLGREIPALAARALLPIERVRHRERTTSPRNSYVAKP